MKTSTLTSILGTLLLVTVNGLDQNSLPEQAECTLSATGEKVCTNLDVDSREENSTDDLVDSNEHMYYDDDDDDDDNDDEYDSVHGNDGNDDNCKDTHESCAFWASKGECTNNPNYMLQGCQKSCNTCPKALKEGLTLQQHEEKKYLLDEVANFGDPQEVDNLSQERTMFVIRKTVDYMKNFIYAEKPTHQISMTTMSACTNNHKLCAYWASIGECENNPSFMVTKCAPSCLSCHKIDYNSRCGDRDPNLPPGLKPGELNLMFEKIVETAPGNATDATQLAAAEGKTQEDGTPFYTVTVHSSPSSPSPKPDDDGVVPVDRKRDHKEDPWVVTFDNFLTEEECKHLINKGYQNGYERSTDVGKKQVDGSYGQHKSMGRTSENAWCESKSGCRQDPVVQRVLNRMAKVTGIPQENYEDLQLLKYEVGQYYKAHHDYIAHQRDRHNGPRILTFFLYLSDVEEGGGTFLNNLGIEVKPKMGRALLWPSVMNHDPSGVDGRTRHEALAVEKGTKFAANAWIHLYNNVEAHKYGCN